MVKDGEDWQTNNKNKQDWQTNNEIENIYSQCFKPFNVDVAPLRFTRKKIRSLDRSFCQCQRSEIRDQRRRFWKITQGRQQMHAQQNCYTARSPKSVRTIDRSQLHVCELQIDQYLLHSDFLVNHRKAC